MNKKKIINGINVAECDKYASNLCYWIENHCRQCLPQTYRCSFYVENLELQLKRTEQQEYENLKMLRESFNQIRALKLECEKLDNECQDKFNTILKLEDVINELKLENKVLKERLKVNNNGIKSKSE